MSTTTTRLRIFDLVPDANRPSGPSRADLELRSVRDLPAQLAGTEEARLRRRASEVALGPTARPQALMEGDLRRRHAHDRSARGRSLSSKPVSCHPGRPVINSAPVGAGAR